METKDKRHKEKRANMNLHKKTFHRKNGNNGSSSSQAETVRVVMDVADFSDDRIRTRQIPCSIDSEFEIENDQMNALDFELLAQISNCGGGHFQFSSEKNWESEEIFFQKSEAYEYFTLNIDLLNAGVLTIPFYKRMEFPSFWFTKYQLKSMDDSAEVAEKYYQSVLRDHEKNHKGKINSTNRKTSTLQNSGDESNSRFSALKAMDYNDQELDNLLSLTTNKVIKVNISEQEKNIKASRPTRTSEKSNIEIIKNAEHTEGIQQWLDDVLEE